MRHVERQTADLRRQQLTDEQKIAAIAHRIPLELESDPGLELVRLDVCDFPDADGRPIVIPCLRVRRGA